MIRNKAQTSMQKTYDECYLICSTAVYFESQGNEAEALRSWRSALDRIYYHNAYRVPANWRPSSETERALQESLHTMEMQCKDRVSLLEALRDSRSEAETTSPKDGKRKAEPATDVSYPIGPRPASGMESWLRGTRQRNILTAAKNKAEPGWIGNGSVPAATYSDLIHAPLPTRLPHPPTLPPRSSEAQAANQQNIPGHTTDVSKPLTPNPPPVVKTGSRTPSPEKKGRMKTTLRDGKLGGKKAKPKASSARPPAASKAAGLAWDYKRVPSSSNAPRTSGGTELRENLSEHESGPRSSGEALSSPPPPPPPPHVYPPSLGNLSVHGEPNEPSVRAEKPSASSNSASKGSASHSEPESRKKIPYEKPPANFLQYRNEYPAPTPVPKASIAAAVNAPRVPGSEPSPSDVPAQRSPSLDVASQPIQRRPMAKSRAPPPPKPRSSRPSAASKGVTTSSDSADELSGKSKPPPPKKRPANRAAVGADSDQENPATSDEEPEGSLESSNWEERLAYVKKHLPKGIDPHAAKQIFNEIVVQGDEVHWADIAGLDAAKKALKEAVVYPFLRPDLFMGLREPARGMLLFGPPGTGKTMLARAVATESRSTFFAISASSLTSKWLGDSEKLVRALFGLARALAPSIIFVDEIDSLLSSRGGSSEHESTRRIKTEFLIQWSDLQRAAAGKEPTKDKEGGDPTRVLVLAATNMPWAIDDAARRRFVRRQYIPLPERSVRAEQLRTLLGHQKHDLNDEDIEVLVRLTDGYSGSDMTALAKDAAMGPLRSLGEALLHMDRDEIRPIRFEDFEASLVNIRPSVSPQGLKEFEDWARDFGERGV